MQYIYHCINKFFFIVKLLLLFRYFRSFKCYQLKANNILVQQWFQNHVKILVLRCPTYCNNSISNQKHQNRLHVSYQTASYQHTRLIDYSTWDAINSTFYSEHTGSDDSPTSSSETRTQLQQCLIPQSVISM